MASLADQARTMAEYNAWMNGKLYDCCAPIPTLDQHHESAVRISMHHRGQLTTLLMQRGINPGVTDFIWLRREAKTLAQQRSHSTSAPSAEKC